MNDAISKNGGHAREPLYPEGIAPELITNWPGGRLRAKGTRRKGEMFSVFSFGADGRVLGQVA